MSRGINRVFLLGNIGSKTELKRLPNGKSVISISLATNSGSKDTISTEWHKVNLFDKLAEVIDMYTDVGSRVHCEGYIKMHTYTNKLGTETKSYEIIANNLLIVDGKKRDQTDLPVENKSKELNDWTNDDVPF